MQMGKETRVVRQHGGTGMVIAVIAMVLAMAGLIAWLLLNPTTRPQREPGEIIPGNAGAVFSFYPSRLVNKSGLPDYAGEYFGGMGKQLDTLADFTKLGIREDQPIHLFAQKGNNGPRVGLTLPLISRETFEKGMKELPNIFGVDNILKQMTEERGLRGVFRGERPFVFAYDHHVLVLLYEDGGDSTELGAALHELFDQESGLSSAEPTFARYIEANHDLGYWVKLEALPQLLGKEAIGNLDQLGDQLQGTTTMSMQFEPGEATLDLMLPGENHLPLRPVDPKLLKTIPEDSMLIFAGGVDLKAVGKQVAATLDEGNGWLNQLGDEVAVDKLREIIQNLTRDEDIDLDAQFTGDIALALTDFELKKVTKAPLIPLTLPDSLQFQTPKLHLAGSFKTKANADTEALLKQFKLTEALGLEAFARDNVLHLASPDLRKSLEQNGMVPNPVDGPTREQLGDQGATLILNFGRLLKVLDQFPEQRAAAAGLEPLKSLAIILHSGDNSNRAVIKLALKDKKVNALRQMIEMGTKPPRVEDSIPVEEEDR